MKICLKKSILNIFCYEKNDFISATIGQACHFPCTRNFFINYIGKTFFSYKLLLWQDVKDIKKIRENLSQCIHISKIYVGILR